MSSAPINIDNDDPFLEYVKDINLNFPARTSCKMSNPQNRSNLLNILLTISFYYHVENRLIDDDDDTIENELFEKTISSFSVFVDSFRDAAMKKLKVSSNSFDHEKYQQMSREIDFPGRFKSFIQIGGKSFPLDDAIEEYTLMIRDVSDFDNFISTMVIEESDKIKAGVTFGKGITLIEPISTAKSLIWKARQDYAGRNGYKAIKFISMDQFADDDRVKNYLDDGKYDKLLVLLRTLVLDFANRSKLKNVHHLMSEYTVLDYSKTLEMAYILMDYYEGSVDKLGVPDRKVFIKTIFDMLFEVHKTGFVLCNVSPSHIVKHQNGYHFIDFKRVTGFKKHLAEVSDEGYTSLNLLRYGIASPYDDIESLLYIWDFLITGQAPSFESLDDEIEKKINLSVYSPNTQHAIVALRTFAQNDQELVNEGSTVNMEQYIGGVYGTVYPIIEEMFQSFHEVSKVQGNLPGDISELANAIKADMVNTALFFDLRDHPKAFDEMAVKIAYHVKYLCEYDRDTQERINMFLYNEA